MKGKAFANFLKFVVGFLLFGFVFSYVLDSVGFSEVLTQYKGGWADKVL